MLERIQPSSNQYDCSCLLEKGNSQKHVLRVIAFHLSGLLSEIHWYSLGQTAKVPCNQHINFNIESKTTLIGTDSDCLKVDFQIK